MTEKIQFIETIDSLLEGEHNLSSEQKQQLIELKEYITKSKTFENLKSIGTDFLHLIIAYLNYS